MQKELSVAFVWHFHQPNYQTQPNGIRLMPWARLHAIKDYLDMLLILDKFPNLKLNFSIVPALIDTIEDYAYNDGHDIHSKLTITPTDELTDDDIIYLDNTINLISTDEGLTFEEEDKIDDKVDEILTASPFDKEMKESVSKQKLKKKDSNNNKNEFNIVV